jgi:nucleoside-diphosphate-sugar epimerase
MARSSVIVSGATSQVGFFLLPRLMDSPYHIHALSRNTPDAQHVVNPHITWHQIDLSRGWKRLNIKEASSFIHLAPLWLLPDIIESLSSLPIHHITALSSTSRFSKLNSKNLYEYEIAKKLAEAEEKCITECNRRRISWTLLRPTMIYGCGMDRNVTMVARFITRFGFFPLVGGGQGYRQPVHADDIAGACMAVMNCPGAFNRTYNLSGGQTLTFKEMVVAIFSALGKKPRIVSIPLKLASLLMKGATLFPAYRHLNREMLERVNQDICFDSSDAVGDFGYSPRGFQYMESLEISGRG